MYRELVRRALAEDFGWGDVTTEAIVDRKQKARGVIVAKSTCVMAGVDIAAEAFRQLDPAAEITIHCGDGHVCERGTEVVKVRGHAAALLTAERTALNFLQRLCGIATLTRQFVDLADGRSPCSIHARRRRFCARSRSTPCAPAAASTTAAVSTMGFSSRTITSASRAASGMPSRR
jgi:nicotinate-nucleotide pyrophosphorylase (carboxylating)